MNENKFGMFIVVGALLGATVSMFDRSTRNEVTRNVKSFAADVSFYSKNPGIFNTKIQEKKEKLQTVVDQISGDVSYVKGKVEELRILTPQVKDLVVETKEAFTEAKDEYKSIVSENSTGNESKEK